MSASHRRISKMSNAMNFICWWHVFVSVGVYLCAHAHTCEVHVEAREQPLVSSEAAYLASVRVSLWPAA